MYLIAASQALWHIWRDTLFVDIGTIGTQQILNVKARLLAVDAGMKARDTALVSAVECEGKHGGCPIKNLPPTQVERIHLRKHNLLTIFTYEY